MLRHVASCLLCLVLFTAGFAASAAEAPPRPEPVVDVERDGSHLAVDIKMTVAVPVATAWDVLTDFPNMARFVPNLSASDSVSEAPNRLRVTQKGTARWGPLAFDFESVRRITLHPMSRIEATTLSGKISKMSSVCQLSHADAGAHIQYHADAEIDFWLPPVVGVSAMRQELAEQFAAMGKEMLRRAVTH